MFTTIVMIVVIVWAISEIGKDLGITDRIKNGGKNKRNIDEE